MALRFIYKPVKPLKTHQRKVLNYVAQGMTNVEAAKKGDYSSGQAVSRLVNSPAGAAHLLRIAQEVDAQAIYSIQSRLADLRNLIAMYMTEDPGMALQFIKEVNTLTKRIENYEPVKREAAQGD